MYVSLHFFDGDPSALAAASTRLLPTYYPPKSPLLAALLITPTGVAVLDSCPNKQIHDAVVAGAEFRGALAKVGLPQPRIQELGNVRWLHAPAVDDVARIKDEETRNAILRFDDAINRHDIDALNDCITEDCLFEDTTPPDGNRHQGRSAVLAACRRLFTESPNAHFEIEDMTTAGDRAVVRWHYRWEGGHVRGVDLVLVKAGRVAQTIAYVKG